MKKKAIIIISIVIFIIFLIMFMTKFHKIKINNNVENTASEEIVKNEVKEEKVDLTDKNDVNPETTTQANQNEVEEENTTQTKQNEVKEETVTPVIKNDTNDEKVTQVKQNEVYRDKTIVIDPGHQTKGDTSKEPIGPGATETKYKVTTGATGTYTKQKESELVLKVSLKLEEELKKQGYKVIMTRTTNNVNISNSERAKIANDANADAFIRIHADSYDNSSVNGISTLCQTSKNQYNGNLAEKSYKLSKALLDNMVQITGAKSRGVTRTDTMSGINWSKVPVSIIEMGFLSNEKEDKLLATSEYQEKIVAGIVNGINEFFEN